MTDDRAADLQVLGLGGEADEEQILRAYRRLEELYHRESLATYSLLTEDERDAKLARIAAACRNLTGRTPGADEAAEASAPSPDPTTAPGAFLRHSRLARNFDLSQVSARTKIRVAVLEDLEAEAFARLPADVYVRGFVIQLARLFGVREPEALSARYLAKLSSARPGS